MFEVLGLTIRVLFYHCVYWLSLWYNISPIWTTRRQKLWFQLVVLETSVHGGMTWHKVCSHSNCGTEWWKCWCLAAFLLSFYLFLFHPLGPPSIRVRPNTTEWVCSQAILSGNASTDMPRAVIQPPRLPLVKLTVKTHHPQDCMCFLPLPILGSRFALSILFSTLTTWRMCTIFLFLSALVYGVQPRQENEPACSFDLRGNICTCPVGVIQKMWCDFHIEVNLSSLSEVTPVITYV